MDLSPINAPFTSFRSKLAVPGIWGIESLPTVFQAASPVRDSVF
jgi:hypothetical protein